MHTHACTQPLYPTLKRDVEKFLRSSLSRQTHAEWTKKCAGQIALSVPYRSGYTCPHGFCKATAAKLAPCQAILWRALAPSKGWWVINGQMVTLRGGRSGGGCIPRAHASSLELASRSGHMVDGRHERCKIRSAMRGTGHYFCVRQTPRRSRIQETILAAGGPLPFCRNAEWRQKYPKFCQKIFGREKAKVLRRVESAGGPVHFCAIKTNADKYPFYGLQLARAHASSN